MALRPAALAMLALALACACSFAHGVAFQPQPSILNRLQVQRTILSLNTTTPKEGNPYGLVLITKTQGNLIAGNFLATQWNDNQGNPGQGHSILQISPNGRMVSVFATINPNDPNIQKECGNVGVGLTMALTILSKGIVVVGSTPIPVGGTVAGPGCLIALDSRGNVLTTHKADEPTTTPGVRTGGGPWAFAIQEFNGGANINLFVSYVLGSNPASTDTLTGAQGGKVVRYQLQVPGTTIPPEFWGNAPEVIASGFPTQPGNIGGGAVGPTGLLLVKDPAHNDRLFISNNLANSVGATPAPGACFTRPGGSPKCAYTPHVWGGLCQGPIGLALSPFGTIVVANGLSGTLFEFAVGAHANNQLAIQLVDISTGGGAGTLFNVLFPNPQTLLFNDDGFNTFNTLTIS